MKAQYGNPTNTLVVITLEPGETLGTHSCAAYAKEPLVRPILTVPVNPEGDEVIGLISKGKLKPTPLYPTAPKAE